MKKKTAKKPAKRAAARKQPRQAGAASKLSMIRRKLLEMRDDLAKTVHKQRLAEDAQDTGDSVDQASQSIEKELLFELSDNERLTLDQIEAALRKIDKGTYGVCESCRKPIGKMRLQALPFARYCISCQNSSETVPESAEQGPDFRNIGEEPAAREL